MVSKAREIIDYLSRDGVEVIYVDIDNEKYTSISNLNINPDTFNEDMDRYIKSNGYIRKSECCYNIDIISIFEHIVNNSFDNTLFDIYLKYERPMIIGLRERYTYKFYFVRLNRSIHKLDLHTFKTYRFID